MKKDWLFLGEEDRGQNDWDIIVPNNDSAPHATSVLVYGENKEGQLAGFDCPCKPTVNFIIRMIVHHAFDGRK